MAEKNGVYVYAKDTTDFSDTGLVGDLQPISAVFMEERNGISQVVIRLPYDEYKRWKACQPGNYIKAMVPVRIPPKIENDEYANTAKVYKYEQS